MIPAGQTQGTIQVNAVDDTASEGTERVTLTLGVPTGATLGSSAVHEIVIDDDEPDATISFSSSSLTVLEGAGTASVEVVLSAPRSEEVRVTFTQSGSADATGGDVLVSPPSPIVFAPQATSSTLSLAITPDQSDEPDETLTLGLIVPVNATLGAGTTFELTIEDDDDLPTASFAAASGAAVESDGLLFVDIELSAPSTSDIVIPITATGDVNIPGDLTFSPSDVVIFAGDTSGSVAVTLVDDSLPEPAETLTLTIGAPLNAVVGAQGTFDLLLIDTDSAVPSVAFDSALSSVDEGDGVVSRVVRASGFAPVPITIPVSATGTAIEGTDFNLLTPSVTIPVGALTAVVGVELLDDGLAEDEETLALGLGLSPSASLGALSSHVITITDDDTGNPTIEFTAAASSVGEGDTAVLVAVTMSAVAAVDVTVPVSFAGTATGAGVDYEVTTSPIVIPAGQTTGAFEIVPVQDPLFELTETVVLQLGTPSAGADLGQVVAHTLMLSDDDPQPTVEFPTFRFVVDEADGAYDIELLLSAAAGVDVAVPYTITGRAAGPEDISFPPGPATIAAGETSAIIPITIVQDDVAEPGEAVLVEMGTPLNAIAGAINTHLFLILEVEDGPLARLPDPLLPSTASLSLPQTRVGEASPPERIQFLSLIHI